MHWVHSGCVDDYRDKIVPSTAEEQNNEEKFNKVGESRIYVRWSVQCCECASA